MVTVTATEVPPTLADGLCEVGNTVLNDFDCRFATFFNYGTDTHGNYDRTAVLSVRERQLRSLCGLFRYAGERT